MSAQIQSYRWSDKPVAAKQAIFLVLIGLLVLFLFFRFKSKFQSAPENHAFTQPGHDHNNKNQTAQELAKSGSVAPGGMSIHSRFQSKGGSGSATAHEHNKNAIQERPLFDGKTATLEVSLDQSISSSSGDPTVAASVIAVIPGEVSPSDATGLQGAKLQGQFQSNFDSKRMLIQFRELLTADGRRYAVSGISMDDDGQSIGVPAEYSSGMGMRILGATLGTVINTAEIVGTSRVIENGAGQDALMASQLNQAVTTSAQGATATIPNAFLALEGSFSGNPDDFEREFNHRAACNDALLALARRAFVIEITAEHELKRLNYDSVVIGRRPDGLFTLARGDDEPITVALEVETSLRNRDRIKSVIQCYENTFIEDPDQLSGVLIVAHTPPIVHAYQEVIEQVSKKYQDRFIISNKSDISDVKETILGRTLVSISDHPKSPIKKWAGVRPSKPFKTEPAPSPPITGYTYRDSDSEFGTRSKI